MTESIRLPASTLKPSTVALPGSKSISNRTLLLAALSDNVCEIHSLLKSDDTDRMLEALDKLGVQIEYLPEGRLKVHGTGGRLPNQTADLFLGNAGTAFRPLTAALAVLGGDYHLHGVPRMHERPMAIWWTRYALPARTYNIWAMKTILRFRSANAKTTASALFRLKAMYPANS